MADDLAELERLFIPPLNYRLIEEAAVREVPALIARVRELEAALLQCVSHHDDCRHIPAVRAALPEKPTP